MDGLNNTLNVGQTVVCINGKLMENIRYGT